MAGFKEIEDVVNSIQSNSNADSQAPVFGRSEETLDIASIKKKLSSQYEVKYKVIDVTNENARLILESIMTESLNPNGKYIVIKEETTFTKEGSYIVAVKYLRKIDSTPTTPSEEK